MSSPTALWLLAVGLVILTIGFILCGIPNPWQAGTADGATDRQLYRSSLAINRTDLFQAMPAAAVRCV
ncbi:hypothetical protein [Bosea sp. (in: a-proteobacteria)]|jgi:hypothetical protein|uniref:hypothetical protein n=1 Tax=Bosea sp. (in: a-proteobacteria) TaxID=1871050 RepID=UPI001AC3955A|nr:hypothetical protein [Bosea sp. (in: a-proteobacteria)]MBN9435369.1 hypothetical protein [Bosea sp. (in: a-proteobacteria)]MBN9467264.1 hypothetical protein [Bosea sp. (in: a-proteobacteria)]